MNIRQRVFRGLAAFVVFGAVAATLPSQLNSAAMGANGCGTSTTGTGRYAIADSASPPAANTANVPASYTLVPSPSIAFKLYYSPDSTSAYSSLGAGAGQSNTVTVTSGSLKIAGSTVASPNSVVSTAGTVSIAKVNSTTPGAGTFTSTYTPSTGTATYNAMVSLSAP